ncbi:hypothetical protein [Campylobacter corcagiensis]|uniref:Cytochrome c domain-containing protein n=1 Tax=Campylobacter corcagiensis TaxID=1448857 RepID=A0A7M1LF96_9BACT|nr:hypothetical protein [Campylobacter corcagiensis]QKF64588.1 hypothetical protein CCORG_0729 [Campylobacter corcagiensis]QOQ87239.1 hypothetical protein IMC76_08530 [Campylobacter corcagiensis]
MKKSLILLNLLFINSFAVDIISKEIINSDNSYVSSQCYTKTIDEDNPKIISNPCFTCHSLNKEPNFTYEDYDVQESYDFPLPATKNPFTNLFVDRSEDIAKISDDEILKYVKTDNYKDENGEIILAKKLKNLDKSWDYNKNGIWDGYIPDCEYSFDNEGFDRTKDGGYTGWRAFGYYPFLGTFWPTNGNTDDVLIRLPEIFTQDENAKFDLEIYKINLLIVESLIKQESVKTFDIDESKYGVDLNQNGKFDIANEIVFKWNKPDYDLMNEKLSNFSMSYVGLAKNLLIENEVNIAPGLYPVGTEFLHSVRYIDVNGDKTGMAKRMKELRYGVKSYWQSYGDLSDTGAAVVKEKSDFPDRIDQYIGNVEVGLNNDRGWFFQAFIEDKDGELRPQNYEETLFCMGCHSNIGATADSTFVFQRKFGDDEFQNGWFHWSQKDFSGIKDMVLEDGEGEYAKYLALNNAGDEFRSNTEIVEKFFVEGWKNNHEMIEKEYALNQKTPGLKMDRSWKLKADAMEILKNDISYLLMPSAKRAIKLNKAYKAVVDEQSYIFGRDVNIKPSKNVHKEVEQGESTGIKAFLYEY